MPDYLCYPGACIYSPRDEEEWKDAEYVTKCSACGDRHFRISGGAYGKRDNPW